MQSIELGSKVTRMFLEQYIWSGLSQTMILRLVRLPRFVEEITIETEAFELQIDSFCYRRFTIYDEAGQELIHMMATFCSHGSR